MEVKKYDVDLSKVMFTNKIGFLTVKDIDDSEVFDEYDSYKTARIERDKLLEKNNQKIITRDNLKVNRWYLCYSIYENTYIDHAIDTVELVEVVVFKKLDKSDKFVSIH